MKVLICTLATLFAVSSFAAEIRCRIGYDEVRITQSEMFSEISLHGQEGLGPDFKIIGYLTEKISTEQVSDHLIHVTGTFFSTGKFDIRIDKYHGGSGTVVFPDDNKEAKLTNCFYL